MKKQHAFWNALCVSGLILASFTAQAAQPTELEARIQQLEKIVTSQGSEIQQLRATSGDSWMNQQRAAEVKALIGDVLADADTRASFASHGATAGHNGSGFYIASEDGNFLLGVGGTIQTRYIFNDTYRPERSGTSDDPKVNGFQMRRARFRFEGHVVDPRFTYALQITNQYGADNNDDNLHGPGTEDDGNGWTFLEEANIGYEFADGMQFVAGQMKGPFLREEAVDAGQQLAVERSFTADLFTVDYTQGAGLNWSNDTLRVSTLIHSGTYSAGLDYNQQLVDFAIAGRVEALLAGSWNQFDDFTSSSSGDFALMVGAAINWETPNTGSSTNESGSQFDVIKWTADVSVEAPDTYGLNGFFAVIGQHITDAAGQNDSSTPLDQLAFVAQAGVYLIPDKLELFGRYEYMDLDGAYYYIQSEDEGDRYIDSVDDDKISLITAGINYYLSGHTAKFTLDSVWTLDELPLSDTGAGLTEADSDDQWSLRAQFQLLF